MKVPKWLPQKKTQSKKKTNKEKKQTKVRENIKPNKEEVTQGIFSPK